MSKRTLIILGAVLTVVFGSGLGVFVFSQKLKGPEGTDKTGLESENKGLLQVLTKPEGKLASYQDESGYSFDYTDSIKVEDVTPNDNNYYSSLEMKKGSDTLTVKITVGNINPYKNNKNAVILGTAAMDGITASQYNVGGRLVSVAIDQGVLYVIDGPKDGGFWEETQNRILSSFKFGTQTETEVSDVNTTYEEEIVE